MQTILDRRCRRCGTGKLYLDEDVVTGVVDSVCATCGDRTSVVVVREVVHVGADGDQGGKCRNSERRRLRAVRDAFQTPEAEAKAQQRGERIAAWWVNNPEEAEARRERLRAMPRGADGRVLPGGARA